MNLRNPMLIAGAAAVAASAMPCAAQTAANFPAKPIRIIVPFAPAGPNDIIARIVGQKWTELWGHPTVIENRGGAGGTIGVEYGSKAPPDGYTVIMCGMSNMAVAVGLYPKLGYELLKDFAYVSTVSSGPNVLMVHPSVPVKTFQEFVTLIKAKPDSIRYGSAGLASTGHLAMELLLSRVGAQLVHVPYKGGGGAAVALAGGEVHVGFTSIPAGIPLISAKRVVALAVTSPKRTAALPDVPAVAESGYPGYDVKNTFGIFAPTKTPAAVVNLLNSEIRSIIAMEDVRAKLASSGVDPGSSTSAEHRALMEAEVRQWAKVVKDAKITLQ